VCVQADAFVFCGHTLQTVYTKDAVAVEQWLRAHVPLPCGSSDAGCACDPAHTRPLVLGLDVEWRPTFRRNGPPSPVAVIQVAVASGHVLLFHAFHSGDRRRLPPALARVLACPGVTLVGVGVQDDAQLLAKQYGSRSSGCVDLRSLLPLAERGLGLQSIAQQYVGVGKWKSKSVTMSNWERAPLTPSQQRYAAIDAWVAVAVYLQLQESANSSDGSGCGDDGSDVGAVVAAAAALTPAAAPQAPPQPRKLHGPSPVGSAVAPLLPMPARQHVVFEGSQDSGSLVGAGAGAGARAAASSPVKALRVVRPGVVDVSAGRRCDGPQVRAAGSTAPSVPPPAALASSRPFVSPVPPRAPRTSTRPPRPPSRSTSRSLSPSPAPAPAPAPRPGRDDAGAGSRGRAVGGGGGTAAAVDPLSPFRGMSMLQIVGVYDTVTGRVAAASCDAAAPAGDCVVGGDGGGGGSGSWGGSGSGSGSLHPDDALAYVNARRVDRNRRKKEARKRRAREALAFMTSSAGAGPGTWSNGGGGGGGGGGSAVVAAAAAGVLAAGDSAEAAEAAIIAPSKRQAVQSPSGGRPRALPPPVAL
jgi:hypothetical protein